jgi:hypothetical protein
MMTNNKILRVMEYLVSNTGEDKAKKQFMDMYFKRITMNKKRVKTPIFLIDSQMKINYSLYLIKSEMLHGLFRPTNDKDYQYF